MRKGFGSVLGHEDAVAAPVVVPDLTELVHDVVEHHEVGPDGHRPRDLAHRALLHRRRLDLLQRVTAQDVGRELGLGDERQPPSHLRDLAAVVQVRVVEAEVERLGRHLRLLETLVHLERSNDLWTLAICHSPIHLC